jgi:hypothetical protein
VLKFALRGVTKGLAGVRHQPAELDIDKTFIMLVGSKRNLGQFGSRPKNGPRSLALFWVRRAK